MAIKCPAGCPRKFVDYEHADRHADEFHPGWRDPMAPEKQKGWATPYGFLDFSEPVTYEHALLFGRSILHKHLKQVRLPDEK